ncbi:hypothetical protein ABPG72_011213 [Tetrahymena utriculariae]
MMKIYQELKQFKLTRSQHHKIFFHYTNLNTQYQIPQNMRLYENQKNNYLQYYGQCFLIRLKQFKKKNNQIIGSIFVDKQKYQTIKQSLKQSNEVPNELDNIIEQDYLQNSRDIIESKNDYFLISKKLWNNNEFNRSFKYMQRSLQLAEFYRGTSHKELFRFFRSAFACIRETVRSIVLFRKSLKQCNLRQRPISRRSWPICIQPKGNQIKLQNFTKILQEFNKHIIHYIAQIVNN